MGEGKLGAKRDQKDDDDEHGGEGIAPFVDFVAGGLVSAVSKIAVYPMETRVLLIAIGGAGVHDSRRLWHGVVVKGLENFLYNGLLWFLKERLRPPPPDPSKPEERPPATFIGAFSASCAAVLLAHPSSNIVVGMQASLRKASPSSAFQVSREIMRKYGPGGFFQGWRLSILLRIGSALTLVVYDAVRARLAAPLGRDLSNFVAGLAGRLSEVYSTHPLKTLRYRQQQGQVMIPFWSPAALLELWAGVGTMAVADAVKIGIRFLLIERLRTLLQWLFVGRHRRKRPKSLEPDGAVGDQCQQTLMGA
mmetsp:Transcript_102176/g.288629  ORF Transcript_102176/g.288629 Transcript_102176/m.288629 type:complete len:306 (-) Transcript_102176:193-1110(-)